MANYKFAVRDQFESDGCSYEILRFAPGAYSMFRAVNDQDDELQLIASGSSMREMLEIKTKILQENAGRDWGWC